jgi:hypothetical protein
MAEQQIIMFCAHIAMHWTIGHSDEPAARPPDVARHHAESMVHLEEYMDLVVGGLALVRLHLQWGPIQFRMNPS